VFRVADRYYACADGVWFTSDKPSGAYVLADAVPDALYTIPPTHHAFNVTFARVASATDEAVTYVHTEGYYGSYASGGVVVWGTGHETRESPASLRRAWDNRKYWLERWDRPQLHVWHRSLTYGQGRWFDHEDGIFRVGFDAMSHAKVRSASASAYRTWRGKAVLPADAREEPKPEPEKKPAKRVAKNQAQLYGGPNGEVYKREHGDWYRYKGGRWVHLAGKPTLQEEAKKKEVSRAYRERRQSEYRRSRRSYRRRWRGRRVIYRRPGWGWCGGGVGIGIGGGGTTVARGLMLGGW
jgi:hypothetical protein